MTFLSSFSSIHRLTVGLLCLCFGIENISARVCPGLPETEFLHVYNVGRYEGCTKIDGSIRIVQTTFDGDPYYNRPGIHPDALWAFSQVREITGFLLIQGEHSHFRHMRYFSNLETIHGRELHETPPLRSALSVMVTSVESFDLSSLRNITEGDIVLFTNPNLCYVKEANFDHIVQSAGQRIIVRRNAAQRHCALAHMTCNRICERRLCWGPGIDNCVRRVREYNDIYDFVVQDILSG